MTQTVAPAHAMRTIDTMALPSVGRSTEDSLDKGKAVGRYLIRAPLGAGGMGAVYRAYDPELGREVALKVLRVEHRAGGDESQASARLEREAQALARLSHPNVVAVHDVGRFDGDLFIAMELVEGKTLKQWCRAQPRAHKEILEVFRAAGHGLAAAHREGMVHRDFKPDNVLVGDDGRVRVADFGLARGTGEDESADESGAAAELGAAAYGDGSADDDASDDDFSSSSLMVNTPLTQAGAIMGTPAYMAPEQHTGAAVGPPADQFSFCVALFEALYGKRPFPRGAAVAARRSALKERMATLPSAGKVPAWLRRLLLRGLAARPADRFSSMDDLLAELERHAGARWRRAALASLVFASLCVLGASWLFAAGSKTTLCASSKGLVQPVWGDEARVTLEQALSDSGISYARPTGELLVGILDGYADEWAAVHTEVCEATHVHGTQSDAMFDLRMLCLDRANARVGAFTGLMKAGIDAALLKNAVKTAIDATNIAGCSDLKSLRAKQSYPEPEAPEDRAALSDLRTRLDELQVLLVAGRFAEALEPGKKAVADADRLGHAPTQAEARRIVASLIRETGDPETAVDMLAQAVMDAARAGDHAGEASALARRIWILGHVQDRYDAALALVPSAEAALIRADGAPLLREELANSIGAVHFSRGEYDEARKHWEQRLGLLEDTSDARDPRLGWAHNNLAASLLSEGKFEVASDHLEKARAIWGKTLGDDHPAMATVLANLGIAYKKSEDFDKAIVVQRAAFESFERVYGLAYPETIRALNNLASTMLSKGDAADAETLFRKAVSALEADAAPATYLLSLMESHVGLALRAQSKAAEALAWFRRAARTSETVLGAEDARTGHAIRTLAQALAEAGEVADAAQEFERALGIYEKLESPLVAQVQLELADVLWGDGADGPGKRRKRARELAQAARDELASRPDAAGQLAEADAWLMAHSAR